MTPDNTNINLILETDEWIESQLKGIRKKELEAAENEIGVTIRRMLNNPKEHKLITKVLKGTR